MSGTRNSAFGAYAMNDNLSGSNNSAFGQAALEDNQDGGSNTAIGASTNSSITTPILIIL